MGGLKQSAITIALASKGNPVTALFVVMLFYFAFLQIEILLEHLIFGKRFEHWLDVPISLGFFAYGGYVVLACALVNGNDI